MQIEKKFLDIKSIKGTFVKTVIKDKEKLVINCKFYYKKPDKIRFDYLIPIERSIKSDGKNFWYKEKKDDKFIKKNLLDLSIEEKVHYGLIPGFGFDYLSPIKIDLFNFKFKEEKTDLTIISAIPKNEELPGMEFYIDKQKQIIKSIKYLDGKKTVLSEIEFSDYKEISKDNWFAMRTVASIQNAKIMEETIFNAMRFDAELEDNLFIQ
ncbi:outer membrane lipoprotein carrier protein LolA [Candidatus Poribacteria bacterium]|nr:outer membrane lipoprotein carrier protein LolA [Candidatus Poribacteria bacterium]